VLLPFDRDQLRKRNAADVDAERTAASTRSPEQGFLDTLELSEVVSQLAAATAGDQFLVNDLEAKARLYALPLRAAERS
jgi:hypothetical protein